MTNAVSQISHKLKTPLTVIMSTVNNLLDGAFGTLNEEQIKWIKKLEFHTAQLEKSLDEVMEIWRQQPGFEEANAETQKTSDSVRVSEGKPKGSHTRNSGTAQAPQILVVDDEPDILDTVQEGLQMKGFVVMIAPNGQEALRLALQNPPDLILMDVLLDRQNGVELCREMKSQLGSYTPVILMTGQDDLREKMANSPDEADDLLTKPFQIVELLARVNSMLRLKKLHDELEELHGAI